MAMSGERKVDVGENKKAHLGLVVVGHVDAGKSTTTGRLIYELGGLNDRDLAKLKKEAKELGKDSFLFAFFMDKSAQERNRGVTIDCCTRDFYTEKFHYSIIDAPGHRDFIKNMISGTSQADCALLMVPADKGGFESSIASANHKKGQVEGQTRQHARLLNLYGIDKIIVCINKMDDGIVKYSQSRFNEIRDEVYKMLKKIFGDKKVKTFPFIPISGFKGDNLIQKSQNMKWFDGWKVTVKKQVITGHTLLDALNCAIKPPKRAYKKVFRMPVSSIFKINGIGDVIAGRIEQGQLTPGTNVTFHPTQCGGKVLTIQMHHKPVQIAKCGDNVGINIRGLSQKPKIGDVMCIENDANPPYAVKQFSALIYVQDHPGQLKVGFTPVIHIRTAKVPAKLVEIKWKRNIAVSKEAIESPLFIEKGEEAQVVFEPLKPLVCEPFDVCKPMGRLAGMDQNNLVLLGKVTAVVHKEVDKSLYDYLALFFLFSTFRLWVF
eukprot:530878_1